MDAATAGIVPETRRPPAWIFVSIAWTGPAILAAFEAYMQSRLGNRPPIGLRNLLWEGGDWLLYGLLTPAVFVVARRFPLGRGRTLAHLPVHILASVVLCAAWAGMGLLLQWALFPAQGAPPLRGSLGWFFTSLPFGVAVYFAVLGVEHAVRHFLEARERETQAARLSAQLAEARLGALRMQLQPHFLFNALNALSVVIRDHDTQTADRMIEQLGQLLRRVTRQHSGEEVPLSEELDFVRQYLALEEVRFSDRLVPVISCERGVENAAVPEFILQPLVENAIRHGLARRSEATRVEVTAHRDGQLLVLSVADDGPGPDPRHDGGGIGLANARARLQTLYGTRGSLVLGAREGGGALATVALPYRVFGASPSTGEGGS